MADARRGSRLTRRVRRWLERREAEWVATRCGGDQRCPWCRQWMNQFHGTHIEPFDDGMLDEITCGNCGGSSLWKWEVGFMFIAAAEQPAGATQQSNFGDGPFIRDVIARARDVLAARDMGSRVAAPVEPQPREEISPSTQGRGVNKP